MAGWTSSSETGCGKLTIIGAKGRELLIEPNHGSIFGRLTGNLWFKLLQ